MRLAPCDAAILAFSWSSSRSSRRFFSIKACTLSVTCSLLALTRPETAKSVWPVFANHPLAAAPVRASTRLTPAATPASEVTTKAPISPVRLTWVPPQSSRENICSSCPTVPGSVCVLPMVMTRTLSPYFSPNKAMAPAALASSMAIVSEATTVLPRIS